MTANHSSIGCSVGGCKYAAGVSDRAQRDLCFKMSQVGCVDIFWTYAVTNRTIPTIDACTRHALKVQ